MVSDLLKKLGYTPSAAAKLCVDSKSAISMVKNPKHHGRMKHLDLCFYWLRDQVKMKQMQPIYLNTEDMTANLLTKALPKPQVLKLQREMGLVM